MKKINLEECQKRLNLAFPEEQIKIIKYEKMSGPCTYKCLTCGKESTIYKTSDLFMKKHICNNCWYSSGQGKKTQEQKERAKDLIKENNLEFIEFGYNHKLLKNTIKFKCPKCNSISEFQLVYFLKNPHCSHCTYNSKHLNNAGIAVRLPKEFTLLEDYKGTDEKVLIRHECGFIWKTTVHGLLSDYRCPKCSKKHFKGEQNIIKWLAENKITFFPEYIFDWSENKRYDFYLPDFNLIIEYMGIQHYEEVPFFQRSLEQQKQIDIWKKEQALLHNIQYLEISYKDYKNIELILAQRLSRKESRDEFLEKESIPKG